MKLNKVCNECKRRKKKCSGPPVCELCLSKSLDCRFDPPKRPGPKVKVACRGDGLKGDRSDFLNAIVPQNQAAPQAIPFGIQNDDNFQIRFPPMPRNSQESGSLAMLFSKHEKVLNNASTQLCTDSFNLVTSAFRSHYIIAYQSWTEGMGIVGVPPLSYLEPKGPSDTFSVDVVCSIGAFMRGHMELCTRLINRALNMLSTVPPEMASTSLVLSIVILMGLASDVGDSAVLEKLGSDLSIFAPHVQMSTSVATFVEGFISPRNREHALCWKFPVYGPTDVTKELPLSAIPFLAHSLLGPLTEEWPFQAGCPAVVRTRPNRRLFPGILPESCLHSQTLKKLDEMQNNMMNTFEMTDHSFQHEEPHHFHFCQSPENLSHNLPPPSPSPSFLSLTTSETEFIRRQGRVEDFTTLDLGPLDLENAEDVPLSVPRCPESEAIFESLIQSAPAPPQGMSLQYTVSNGAILPLDPNFVNTFFRLAASTRRVVETIDEPIIASLIGKAYVFMNSLLHILLLFRSARYNQALQELRRLKPFILENFVSSLVLLPKTAFAICHIIGFLADLRQADLLVELRDAFYSEHIPAREIAWITGYCEEFLSALGVERPPPGPNPGTTTVFSLDSFFAYIARSCQGKHSKQFLPPPLHPLRIQNFSE